VPALSRSDGTRPFAAQTDLPAEMRGACIAAHGALTPDFAYIAKLRTAYERATATEPVETPPASPALAPTNANAKAKSPTPERQQRRGGLRRVRAQSFMSVQIRGHLFDTGVINRVLDVVEDAEGASARMVDWDVGTDRAHESAVVLQLFAKHDGVLQGLMGRLREIVREGRSTMSAATSDRCVSPGFVLQRADSRRPSQEAGGGGGGGGMDNVPEMAALSLAEANDEDLEGGALTF